MYTIYLIRACLLISFLCACDSLSVISSIGNKNQHPQATTDMTEIRLDLEHEQAHKSVRLTLLTSDQFTDNMVPILAKRVNQAFQTCPQAYGKSLGMQMSIPSKTNAIPSTQQAQLKLKPLEGGAPIKCIIHAFDVSWDMSFEQGSKSFTIQIEPLINENENQNKKQKPGKL